MVTTHGSLRLFFAHATVTMPFEFINNNATIDHTARKRIRSHVAKERNAGKSLTRPSRKKAALKFRSTATPFRVPKLIEDRRELESNEDEVHEIERQVGNGLSVFSIPKQLDPGSMDIIQRSMYGHLEKRNTLS